MSTPATTDGQTPTPPDPAEHADPGTSPAQPAEPRSPPATNSPAPVAAPAHTPHRPRNDVAPHEHLRPNPLQPPRLPRTPRPAGKACGERQFRWLVLHKARGQPVSAAVLAAWFDNADGTTVVVTSADAGR